MTDFELKRQIFHIVFGGGLLATALLLGRSATLLFYFALLVLGLVILHITLSGIKIPLIEWTLKNFERKTAIFPGQGALMYFAGSLFTFTFAPFEFALAVIAIVAFGDGFATLVGMRGKYGLPWNAKKTWEGFLAFLLTSSAMAALALPLTHAVFYAAALGLVETLDFQTDDNLVLPVTAVAIYHVLGATVKA